MIKKILLSGRERQNVSPTRGRGDVAVISSVTLGFTCSSLTRTLDYFICDGLAGPQKAVVSSLPHPPHVQRPGDSLTCSFFILPLSYLVTSSVWGFR